MLRRLGTISFLLSLGACEAPTDPQSALPKSPSPALLAAPAASAAQGPAPTLTLLVLGDLQGELESCGCGARNVGGLDRAWTLLMQRADPGTAVVLAGNLLFPETSHASSAAHAQEAVKAEAVASILLQKRPQLVVPAPEDLARGVDLVRNWQALGVPLLLPSQRDVGDGASQVLQLPTGARVGVFRERGRGVNAQQEISRLRAQNVDAVLAFVHGACDAQSEVMPADLIVHTGCHRSEVHADGGRVVLAPGEHSEEVWSLQLWRGSEPGSTWQLVDQAPRGPSKASLVRATRLALDETVAGAPSVRAQMRELMQRVETLSRTTLSAATDLAPDSVFPSPRSYVGADNCAPCHIAAYEWWRRSRHGRAFSTLEKRGRALDLACVGCHVTAFEQPGGATLGRLTDFRNVGCESCHGPGARHVDNPRNAASRPVSKPALATCEACHDRAHSSNFDPTKMTQALRVPGHGAD